MDTENSLVIEYARLLNSNVDPSRPKGWKIKGHKKLSYLKLQKIKDGELLINGKEIGLYLSPLQLNGKLLLGDELLKEISKKEVLNAVVLEFLIDHPEFIPDSWKRDAKGNIQHIVFWGTLYKDFNNNAHVRYIFWNDANSEWDEGHYLSFHQFGENCRSIFVDMA